MANIAFIWIKIFGTVLQYCKLSIVKDFYFEESNSGRKLDLMFMSLMSRSVLTTYDFLSAEVIAQYYFLKEKHWL
jgi:hypothetical protein